MTNAMIIEANKQELARAGILRYTGRVMQEKMADGSVIECKEVEPIHTFAAWKALGYQVKKGEHATAKFTIWKYRAGTKEVDGEEIDTSRMFMKLAYFFTAKQVEKI